jgi:hypothetical protein
VIENTLSADAKKWQVAQLRTGAKEMKTRAISLCLIAITGTIPYAAFATPLSKFYSAPYSSRLIEKVSCDTRNEDKQALCMQACDDTWIKATQAYNANIDQAKVQKKECEAKCGC